MFMLKLFLLKVNIIEIVRNADATLNSVIHVYTYNNKKSVSTTKTSVILDTPVYQNAFRFLFIILSWIRPFGTSSIHVSNAVRPAKTVLDVSMTATYADLGMEPPWCLDS
jgi:hypothetical protein